LPSIYDSTISNHDFKETEKFVLSAINSSFYPAEHPFLTYPRPTGMLVEFLIKLKVYLDDEVAVRDLIKKCRSIVDGHFNWERYNQNASEVIILYYIIIGIMKNNPDKLDKVFYENENIFSNNKKLEYSFLFKDQHLLNIEVKTLTCDPLIKESQFLIRDGLQLIKPFFKNIEIEDFKNQYPQATILKDSSNYRQLSKNLKKIIEKFDGENLTHFNMINIGIVIINFSTSMEEFFSYLYNSKNGLLLNVNFKNLDCLVLFSLDNANDIEFQNVYNMGYIQTALINDNSVNREYMKMIRMDNYMSMGNISYEGILRSAQQEYGVYKTLVREGMFAIVPWETSEEEIKKYIEDLKCNAIRGRDNKLKFK